MDSENAIRVLFDHQIFCIQKTGGISRYITSILNYAQAHPEAGLHAELSLQAADNFYLTPRFKQALPWYLKSDYVGKKHLLERYNRCYTLEKIKHQAFDVFFPTYYNTYFLSEVKKPYILTVHDMTHEHFPEYFRTKRDFTLDYKEKAIQNAAGIIAISEHTRQDLMAYYNVPGNKIRVIHHGICADFDSEAIENLPTKFFLYVGERGGYKNFECLVFALGKLADTSVHLVCTGKAFTLEEHDLLRKHNLGGRSHVFSVNDAALNFMYQNALALVYPSRYEGFGYPLIEAMRAGCRVLSSNSSCLPEIGGNVAAYFDPDDIEALYALLAQTLTFSAEEQMRYVAEAKMHFKKFQLEQSMRQTIDFIRQCARK
jgi:glycosyltransferase involved in cell wall biosynthesis